MRLVTITLVATVSTVEAGPNLPVCGPVRVFARKKRTSDFIGEQVDP
jgi:hypothetical protein